MKSKIKIIRYIFLLLLLVTVWIIQAIPYLGAEYARRIYPGIASFLSFFSSRVPFSVGDLFILLSVIGLIIYTLYGIYRKIGWRKIIFAEIEYLLWIYIWFYLAWGLNYSQPDFYQRTLVQPATFSEEKFAKFVDKYLENLHNSYTELVFPDLDKVQTEIVKEYRQQGEKLGIHLPGNMPQVKWMLFSNFIAKTGVSGYMGPFFCEFNLNKNLLPMQYPATYAHELAHYLGITSEAEANFYAYMICTSSSSQEIRFCGYFSILGYMIGNIYNLLGEEEFEKRIQTLHPEIMELYRQKQEHWSALYSPILGNIQNKIYDFYLKGNRIPEGRKNYSHVIGLLVSYEEHQNNINNDTH